MRVAFCFPGGTFTSGFVQSWTKLEWFCLKNGITPVTHWAQGSSVVHVRNQLLHGGMAAPMKDVTPFEGDDYDWMMWIDSDTVFEPEDVMRLIAADKDIITGLVPMDEHGNGALGLVNNFSPTKYMILPSVQGSEPFEVEFCGFAFLLVRAGVFESLGYPWFKHLEIEVNDRIQMPSEDFSWCIRVRQQNWKIHAHPLVRLGHEKRITLR